MQGDAGAARIASYKKQIHHFVEIFTIAKLKIVLKAYNLSTTGRKNILQERLLWMVRDASETFLTNMLQVLAKANAHENAQPAQTYTDRVNNLLANDNFSNGYSHQGYQQGNHAQQQSSAARSTSHGSMYRGPQPPQQSAGRPYPIGSTIAPQPRPLRSASRPQTLEFVSQPFYSISHQLSPIQLFCGPYSTPTQQAAISFHINNEHLQKLKGSHRLVVLSQRWMNGESRPIYYPFNSEVYLNGDFIHTNHRGIKGVEGSARPIDLTDRLVSSPKILGTSHQVTFRFTVNRDPSKDDQTAHKSFAIGVYMISDLPIENVVSILNEKAHIPRDKVLNQLRTEQDDEIIETETNHSLKDPITFTRMALPIRSVNCKHVDCYDAASFLMFQKQAPTWKCPHCNNLISFNALAVDDFMLDILQNSGQSVDRVTISPDGTWKVVSTDSDFDSSEDDDEEVPRIKPKKVQPEVIDLLSDSDDDPSVLPNAVMPLRAIMPRQAGQDSPQGTPPTPVSLSAANVEDIFRNQGDARWQNLRQQALSAIGSPIFARMHRQTQLNEHSLAQNAVSVPVREEPVRQEPVHQEPVRQEPVRQEVPESIRPEQDPSAAQTILPPPEREQLLIEAHQGQRLTNQVTRLLQPREREQPRPAQEATPSPARPVEPTVSIPASATKAPLPPPPGPAPSYARNVVTPSANVAAAPAPAATTTTSSLSSEASLGTARATEAATSQTDSDDEDIILPPSLPSQPSVLAPPAAQDSDSEGDIILPPDLPSPSKAAKVHDELSARSILDNAARAVTLYPRDGDADQSKKTGTFESFLEYGASFFGRTPTLHSSQTQWPPQPSNGHGNGPAKQPANSAVETPTERAQHAGPRRSTSSEQTSPPSKAVTPPTTAFRAMLATGTASPSKVPGKRKYELIDLTEDSD